jgi:hypothetical protein
MKGYSGALENYILSQGKVQAEKVLTLIRLSTRARMTGTNIEDLAGYDSSAKETAKLIEEFTEGQNTNIYNNKTSINLEEFLKNKGKHFCAGYLSKFGRVICGTGIRSDIQKYSKIKPESQAYNTALKMYGEYISENLSEYKYSSILSKIFKI